MEINSDERFLWTGKPALEIGIRQLLFLNLCACLLLFCPVIILNSIQITMQTVFNHSYYIYPYEMIVIGGISFILMKEDEIFTRNTFKITNEIVSIEISSIHASKSYLQLAQVKAIKVKKGFWDIEKIKSGSIIITESRNGKKNFKLKYIADVNKVAMILEKLIPNTPVKLDNSEPLKTEEYSEENLHYNAKILWNGKKSSIYFHEFLWLTSLMWWLVFSISMILIQIWSGNNLTRIDFSTVLLIIFASCYVLIGAFNYLVDKAANNTCYIITDTDLILVHNRIEEKMPLMNIKTFQIKRTALKCQNLDIGTIRFYDRIHKRPHIIFHNIENLNSVANLLTNLNLPSMDKTNWVLGDIRI